MWPNFEKPTELSYYVFWEIPVWNIETTVVPFVRLWPRQIYIQVQLVVF